MNLNLDQWFAKAVLKQCWWQPGQPIVVAVSTGVDSMVLLSLLQHLHRHRPQIIVAHVNHQLRDASDEEQTFLTAYCKQHHLTLVVATWARDQHPITGVEAAARQFRYAFFERVLRKFKATVLVTAHHQNDQAETVLMKLTRGDDLSQLRGIQPRRPFANGQLVRPLLTLPKATLVQYAHEHQLHWYEDQTNQSDEVTRNRIRHHWIPMMERENPQVVSNLGRFATQLSSLLTANQWLLTQLLTQIQAGSGYQLTAFLQLPSEVQIQLLRLIDAQLADHQPLTTKQLQMVQTILNNRQKTQGNYPIGAVVTLQKQYMSFQLEFRQNVAKNPIQIRQTMVRLNHWYRINNQLRFGVFRADRIPDHFVGRITQFQLAPDCFPLTIRPWRTTDRMRLKSGGHQKINRIFIDNKVPTAARNLALVLVDQRLRILSLLGYKDAVLPTDPAGRSYRLLVQTEFERRIP